MPEEEGWDESGPGPVALWKGNRREVREDWPVGQKQFKPCPMGRCLGG